MDSLIQELVSVKKSLKEKKNRNAPADVLDKMKITNLS